MCQGAIVSLVKFKPAKRTKSIILSGVGSHSGLIKDNLTRLTKADWRDNLPDQKVFSIESDFSGWNKFTIQAGIPNYQELKVLKSNYKKIAGNATALIRHVKRCGKIDDALLCLLTAPAWEQYNKVRAQALEQYNKVTAPALEQYNKVKAPALEQYNKVKAQAWLSLFNQKANRIAALR